MSPIHIGEGLTLAVGLPLMYGANNINPNF
jgi:hypothetical protein